MLILINTDGAIIVHSRALAPFSSVPVSQNGASITFNNGLTYMPYTQVFPLAPISKTVN